MEIPLVIAALAAANGTDPFEEARKHVAALAAERAAAESGGTAAQPGAAATRSGAHPGAAVGPPTSADLRISAGGGPPTASADGVDHPSSGASLSGHGAPLDNGEPAMVTGTHRATGGRLRRLAGDYAWVIVAVVLAVLVALCSLPFTTGLAPSWRAGAPAVPSAGTGLPVAPMAATFGTAPSGSPSSPLFPNDPSSGSPADGSPTGSSPDGASPNGSVPNGSAPDGSAPDGSVPNGSAPGADAGAGRIEPSAQAGGSAEAPAPRATTLALGPASSGDLKASIRLYCWQEFGASGARLRSGPDSAAGDWECRGPGFTRLVDLTAMCSWRYGPGTFAAITDRHDAYSWRCFRDQST
ncbi:hypothetical protein [Catenuloplanes japonicus]|uniref:hypothetical protein n=1 Tax=Catenuloplanes japonicus TaxID=33876 RepID=UPI0005248E14|nr:hypothetical protein [Catenuloplanes japonicus]